jgi:hypothetical protein
MHIGLILILNSRPFRLSAFGMLLVVIFCNFNYSFPQLASILVSYFVFQESQIVFLRYFKLSSLNRTFFWGRRGFFLDIDFGTILSTFLNSWVCSSFEICFTSSISISILNRSGCFVRRWALMDEVLPSLQETLWNEKLKLV